jgi:membrane-associated phospholipid phosphatase
MPPAPSSLIAWGRRWVLPLAAAGMVMVIVARAGRRLVVTSDAIGRWDLDVVRSAAAFALAHPPLPDVLLWWQAGARGWVLHPLLVLLALLLWVRAPDIASSRQRGARVDVQSLRSRCVFVAVLATVGALLGYLAKLAVARARPDLSNPVEVLSGLSFPSGHATNASLAGSLLVVLLWPLLGRTGRVVAVVGASVFVVLTCLDRVFLGVHFPSDVIAGVVLGLGMTTAACLVRARWP